MINNILKFVAFCFIFTISMEQVLIGPNQDYLYKYYVESDDTLINPYMGYAPWASSMNKEYMPEINVSLAFALVYWKDIEPQKGYYDFEAFEKSINFDRIIDNNVRLIIRVVCDYPTNEEHIDIPQWLYDEIDGAGTFYSNENGLAGFVPDYSNPYFIERHSLMIQALAKRYDNSPNIAFVQLGSLGHWGEWHNVASPDSPFPDSELTNEYVKHYLSAFTQTKLQMRRPYTISKDNDIGLYNDMTGYYESTYLWLDWIDDYDMTTFYYNSPSGGEFASTYSMDSYFGESYSEVKQMVIDSHMTYIGNLPPDKDELRDNIDDLLKTLGYRFTLRYMLYTPKINVGDEAYIHINIENVGIAPFYYPWTFYYLFFSQDGELIWTYELEWDVRKILPDNSYTYTDMITLSLPAGDYTIKLGLFNPDSQIPEVQFANIEAGNDRLLTIGDIKIIE